MSTKKTYSDNMEIICYTSDPKFILNPWSNLIPMSFKSLRIVTVALDVHSASAKGAMHSIGGTVESRLKEVQRKT